MSQTKTLHSIFSDFAEFAKTDSKKLIKHLKSIGYSQSQIARILEISRQGFADKYEK